MWHATAREGRWPMGLGRCRFAGKSPDPGLSNAEETVLIAATTLITKVQVFCQASFRYLTLRE